MKTPSRTSPTGRHLLLPLLVASVLGAMVPGGSATAGSPAPGQPLHLAQAAATPGAGAGDAAPPGDARLPLDDDTLPANAEAIMRTPRFRQLTHELRCLVCQNQTLLDSHAPLAQDLRHEVVRLVASGMDDEQVKRYLVDRYGEFVLYRPTWSWRNAVLWLGPALMLLLGGLMGWRVLAQRRRALASASPGGLTADTVSVRPVDARATTPVASTTPRPANPADQPDSAMPADSTGTDDAFQRASEALQQVDALLARGDDVADHNSAPAHD